MGVFDDIAQAIRDMGTSLRTSIGESVKEALDETVGDTARERARQREAQEIERRLVEETLQDPAMRFFTKSRKRAMRLLLRDERMPKSLNYKERYRALLKIDDRRQVLTRIGQTIDRAKEIVRSDALDHVDKACRDAAESVWSNLKRLDATAEQVLGTRLSGAGFARYTGGVTCVRRVEPEVLEQLAAEVDRSFATFRDVVMDNGLFAAFAPEGSYGACKGWRGWWDWDGDLYDDTPYLKGGGFTGEGADVQDIPGVFEEDAGGDAPVRAVERMREENKRPYDGFLDDDVAPHVNAFWYGFKKLMVFANGMYQVDMTPLSAYWETLERQVNVGCNRLAENATPEQAVEFAERVKELKKGATDLGIDPHGFEVGDGDREG